MINSSAPNLPPCSSQYFWRSTRPTLCKISLCASAILIVLGGLALAGLLFPHSSIGTLIIHSFGQSGIASILITSTFCFLATAILLLASYLKNTKKPSINDTNPQKNNSENATSSDETASTINFSSLRSDESLPQENDSPLLKPEEDDSVPKASLQGLDDVQSNFYLEINQHLNLIGVIAKPLPFSPEELLTFKLVLKKVGNLGIIKKFDDFTCIVRFSKNKFEILFELRKEVNPGYLNIQIDSQGQILDVESGLSIASKSFPLEQSLQISEKYLPLLRDFYEQAIQESSSYKNGSIVVCREALKALPAFHLNKFSALILDMATTYKINSMVSFFSGKSAYNEQGLDRGGLTREYFDTLFRAVFDSKILSFQKITKTRLLVPKTNKEYQKENTLPELESDENELYKNMGSIFMCCFYSKRSSEKMYDAYSIGLHFDAALFKAVFSLTATEIDTPFTELSFQTQLKICRALVEAHKERIYYRRIELLSKNTPFTDKELKEAAEIAFIAETFPDRYQDSDNCIEEVMALENKEEVVRQALWASLIGFEGFPEGLLGEQIAPIHAIAQGMKLYCYKRYFIKVDDKFWKNELANGFEEFSNKVQGVANNGNHIADQIVIDPFFLSMKTHFTSRNDQKALHSIKEVEKKFNWLKEWVRDEASEEEIEKLLQFVTGSPSLSKDAVITVKMQHTGEKLTVVPEVHTCSFEICLSGEALGDEDGYNDYTKESFVKVLKDFALNTTDYTYSVR